MRIFLALIAACAILLPCTSSMADDLEAVILVEMPAFTCLSGSIQFLGDHSTGASYWLWDIDNDGDYEIQGSTSEKINTDICWDDHNLGGGDYTVKLTVRDNQIPPTEDSTTVSNIYVAEPIIVAEQRLGTYIVDFNGTFSEPTTLDQEYAWDLDDDGQLDDSTSGTPSWNFGGSG